MTIKVRVRKVREELDRLRREHRELKEDQVSCTPRTSWRSRGSLTPGSDGVPGLRFGASSQASVTPVPPPSLPAAMVCAGHAWFARVTPVPFYVRTTSFLWRLRTGGG